MICAGACQSEKEAVPEISRYKTISVHAGEAGATRTQVETDGTNYSVKWSEGDRIAIAEIIEANYSIDGGPSPCLRYDSDPLPAAGASATFSVKLDDRSSAEANPSGDLFKYIGVYPNTGLYDVRWTGDNRAEWEENWGDTTTPDHAVLMVELPSRQFPTATSFDPEADLLVSEVVSSATQPDELTMRFARVGTIAKITLKGLPTGKNIESGRFSFPHEWAGAYIVGYDPVLKKTGVFEKSSGMIEFMPDDVAVNESGEAVIWLRTLSGVLDNWFNFEVTLFDGKGGELEKYEKRVDLASLGRTIRFPESGVTTFSVSMQKHYNLVMNLESNEVGETSMTLNMHYDLGGKPYTTVS